MANVTDRRTFLSSSAASFGFLSLGTRLSSIASAAPFRGDFSLSTIGELEPVNSIGLRLPRGFSSRIVATAQQKVTLASGAKSSYAWHKYPDGGACFATDDGGWIYTSNSEIDFKRGGAGVLRFNSEGEIVDAYSILKNTSQNCAGGPTPWQSWLSCEEIISGQVFDCDIYGKAPASPCPGLGYFKHEAVAIDPRFNRVYLTEDESDGCLYRYTATDMIGDRFDFTSGLLEVASVASNDVVSWIPVPNPNPSWLQTPTRKQVEAATHFSGGEGIWYHQGKIIFTTKGDNRVREYDIESSQLKVIYDKSQASSDILNGVDNVFVTNDGNILVAEDGDDLQIVVLDNSGAIFPLVQVVGHFGSEITGPAINPRGDKLYFSSQRGDGGGITYEVTGNFTNPMS